MKSTKQKLLLRVGIILCLNVFCCSGLKVAPSSARKIAVHAGAAQFKESIEESDQAIHRHRRLAADSEQFNEDDTDYEVYQGVVGRPGIDFPIYVAIPRTNFNCRKMGNGYFADLETGCQVFHICDLGRKISFLCPNGTIFKQNELICDWWFKVDCPSSPRQYIESADVLLRDRNKARPSVKATSTESHLKNAEPSQQTKFQDKSKSRYGGTLVRDSGESYDFEDITESTTSRRRQSTIGRTTIRSVDLGNHGANADSNEGDSILKVVGNYLSDGRADGSRSIEPSKTDLFNFTGTGFGGADGPTQAPTESTRSPSRGRNPSNRGNNHIAQTTTNAPTQQTQRRPISRRIGIAVGTNNAGVTTNKSSINLSAEESTSNESVHEMQLLAESASFVKPNSGFSTNIPQDNDKPHDHLKYNEESTGKQSNNHPAEETVIPIGNYNEALSSSTTTATPIVHIDKSFDPTRNYYSDDLPFSSRATTVSYAHHISHADESLNQNQQNYDDDTFAAKSTTTSDADEIITPTRNYNEDFSNAHSTSIKPTVASYEIKHSETVRQSRPARPTTILPTTYSRRGGSKYRSSTSNGGIKNEELTFTTSTPSFNRDNGYSTAKRLGTTRSHDAPFYTPTVPTIINKQPILSTASAPPPTQKTQIELKPVEHAIEMMKMLSELDISQDILPPVEESPSFTSSGERRGLNIPASSSPDTLHSLALYFAETADNFKHQNNESEKINFELLSEKTVKKYDELFSKDDGANATAEEVLTTSSPVRRPAVPVRFSSDESSDLQTAFTKHSALPQGTSPQIRELAQVFTHALSAYLHNPDEFHKLLIEIRPQEPKSSSAVNEIFTNRIGRTELPPFVYQTTPVSTNGATYLPTTASVATTTPYVTDGDDQEVLDFSDVTISSGFRPDATQSVVTETPSTTEFIADVATTETATTTIQPNNQPFIKSAEKTPGSDFIAGHIFSDYSKSNELAMEINGNLLLSTIYPYSSNEHPKAVPVRFNSDAANHRDQFAKTTTETPDVTTESVPESTTEIFSLNDVSKKFSDILIPSGDILLPFSDINDELTEVDENLQSAHSQSLVTHNQNAFDGDNEKRQGKEFTKANSDLTIEPKSGSSDAFNRTMIKGHYITARYPHDDENTSTVAPTIESETVSPFPWSDLKYTVFLDPHTINDELMGFSDPTTETTTTSETTTYSTPTTTDSHFDEFDITTASSGSRFLTTLNRHGKSLPTTQYPSHSESHNSIEEQPMEVMQEKANELFGALNETQANSLMHVMENADSNKTVRKLILLLIQTCDEDFNSTVQESRNALLNALIQMDNIDVEHEIRVINTRKSNRRDLVREILTQIPSKHSSERLVASLAEESTTTASPSTISDSSDELAPTIETAFRIDLSEEDEFPTSTTNYGSYEYSSTQYYEYSTQESTYETTTTYPTTTDSTTAASSTVYPTTTARPATTRAAASRITATTTSTTVAPTTLRTKKRTGKSLDRFESSFSYDNNHNPHSDERALELLRSLYSLASKWGGQR